MTRQKEIPKCTQDSCLELQPCIRHTSITVSFQSMGSGYLGVLGLYL